LFEAAGAKVAFVGHPAMADDVVQGDGARFRARIGAAAGEQILLVLPGSRASEVNRLMPTFEEAVSRLKSGRPSLHVVVAPAATVAEQVTARVAGWPFRAHLVQDAEERRDAMVAADVALACSGTVTTELAVAGCPMVVAYRLGPLSYQIARRIVRTRFITLINIAADAAVAPELIQGECTGERLAAQLARRLDDPGLRHAQSTAQTAALEDLGGRGPPPAERAAEAIAGMLSRRS
jgi:lipid-A-disaccharide synthase